MQKEKWTQRSARIFFALAVLFAVYIALKYAVGIIFPFLAAFMIAVPIVKLSAVASRRLGGSRSNWCVFFVLVFWLFLFVLIFAAIRKLLLQTEELFMFFGEHISQISESAEKIYNVSLDIPLLKELLGGAETASEGWISSLLENISAKGGEVAAFVLTKMATFTPRLAIGLVVCIISSFYFCKDWEKIKNFAVKIIPSGAKENTRRIIFSAAKSLSAYLKAYTYLFIITFCELFVGLILLGRSYAFICALLIAALDILPLLGSGIVLVPWGVVLIVGGDMGIGIGMLVLFGVISVARQIIEPRIVGEALGIHPLATLAAMYIGIRVFGVSGILLLPLSVVFIKGISESAA